MQKNTRLPTLALIRLAVVLSLSISLAACGFYLRGNIPLPEGIQSMYVNAPEGEFKDVLSEVLVNSGAQLATGSGGADVILTISKAITNRTVGTLDERGKANSYNLRFTVKYELTGRGAEQDAASIRTASLMELRRYNFDPDLVIESESEEAELQLDMEEAISLRIVRQLSTITNYTPRL